METKQLEYVDSLYWTALTLNQLGEYRTEYGGKIPKISFNVWGADEKHHGHKYLDEMLSSESASKPISLPPMTLGENYVMISVEEPHTYFARDSWSEGSLENILEIPLDKHITVEWVGSKIPYSAIEGLKLSERVILYYQQQVIKLDGGK